MGVNPNVRVGLFSFLPLNVDFINENASVANPDPRSQNSLCSQISTHHGCTYGMLDGGCLLLHQRVKRCINYTHATSFTEHASCAHGVIHGLYT